jgi:hypothetical protein
MVIFGKPKNINDFICVNGGLVKKLHSLGFQPIYRYFNDVYFIKNKEVEEVVSNWNLNIR